MLLKYNLIKFKLGYSHFLYFFFFNLYFYINIIIQNETKFSLYCLSKFLLLFVIKTIKNIKKIEIFTGKGIFFENEKFQKKKSKKIVS